MRGPYESDAQAFFDGLNTNAFGQAKLRQWREYAIERSDGCKLVGIECLHRAGVARSGGNGSD